jgi:hypothetical protein
LLSCSGPFGLNRLRSTQLAPNFGCKSIAVGYEPRNFSNGPRALTIAESGLWSFNARV